MCTAATFFSDGFYFGRTLDNDCSYGEEVVITPRNFVFDFRLAGRLKTHFALIGTACVKGGFPLYYDAANEKGLCIAGLNFVGNAHYRSAEKDKINLAQFELVPYILGKCACVDSAIYELTKINLTDTRFAEDMPAAELHWLIADCCRAVVLECTKDGMRIFEDPAGVLTNNPPFEVQLFNLNDYMSLSPHPPKNTFCDRLNLKTYGKGMGALGLPGDLSSRSRFVRAAFVRNNSVCGDGEEEGVNCFFHILGSVEQQRGCCLTESGGQEITVYTSCFSARSGTYYYTTYQNHAICAVKMFNENLDGSQLARYPHVNREQFVRVNN